MSPWNRILNYGKEVNRKVGTTLTTDTAKKIRKNLLIWGAVAVAVSGIGIIVGLIISYGGIINLITKAGSNMFDAMGDSGANCPEVGEEGWFECRENSASQNEQNILNMMSGMMGMAGSAIVGMLIGFIVMVISILSLTIGITLIRAGIAIIVTGEGAKFLDTAPKCPKCGDPVDQNEVYCNKCGADIRNKNKCSCGTQNDVEDVFCRSCGKKLGE